MAAKSYKRVARTHAIAPERWPLEKKSIKVTVAPVRLARNVGGQNRRGLGNPHP